MADFVNDKVDIDNDDDTKEFTGYINNNIDIIL